MRNWVLHLAVLGLMPWPIAHSVCGQENGERPILKFLDDFRTPYAESRDPFEERIETDRHDFTQSTKTVGRLVAQVEAGYSYFYKDQDGEIENSHTTPEMMLRVGLTEDIEFRLRFNHAWRFIDVEPDDIGTEDLRWSFKLGMTEQECYVPESALEVRFTTPTGGEAWSTERVEFGIDYIYGWELDESWTLYGSTGMNTDGLADFSLLPDEPATDRFLVWTQSVAIGTELTERSTLYTEWFGLFSQDLAHDFSISFFNMGIDYYVTDHLVVDFRAGVGLTDDSDDFFAGVGGGYRF